MRIAAKRPDRAAVAAQSTSSLPRAGLAAYLGCRRRTLSRASWALTALKRCSSTRSESGHATQVSPDNHSPLPSEEVEWLSPITSSYSLCAVKSCKVVCWDVRRDMCLAEWDSKGRWTVEVQSRVRCPDSVLLYGKGTITTVSVRLFVAVTVLTWPRLEIGRAHV